MSQLLTPKQDLLHTKIWGSQAYDRLSSFSLIKKTTYKDPSKAREIGERLNLLKQSDHRDFGPRVKIPEYDFEVDGHEVIIHCEYIKGAYIYREWMPILREALLERENPWTFPHPNYLNFLIDTFTKDISTAPIYIIDLEDYVFMPSRTDRVSIWNEYMEEYDYPEHKVE